MSRSYRKPWYTDGYDTKSNRRRFFKRYANRVVRRTPDIANGKAYRKVFDSWSICDFKFPYNPKPLIYWRRGEPEIIEPLPFWQVCRK